MSENVNENLGNSQVAHERPSSPPAWQTTSEIISVGEWIGTFLICCIPLVGFIMMFVWAFGGNANETKANWAKAGLLMAVIGIGIWILFMVIFAGVIGSMM